MREYHYLTGLKDSPYDLTIAEALYHGGMGELSAYFFCSSKVTLDNRPTLERIEAEGVFLKLPAPKILEIENAYVQSQAYGRSADVALCRQFTVSEAYITKRYGGVARSKPPFKKEHREEFLVNVSWTQGDYEFHETGIPIVANDILIWSYDLERLAEQGQIKRRTNDTTSVVSDQTNTEATELRRTQRTLAALAIGLAEKHPGYKHGSKPNALQLAKLATEHLRDGESDRTPHGFSETTARQTITEALKACPELSE